MNRLRLRAHLHTAAAASFRSTGGCATATVNAGIEAPCAEDRIA